MSACFRQTKAAIVLYPANLVLKSWGVVTFRSSAKPQKDPQKTRTPREAKATAVTLQSPRKIKESGAFELRIA
jgi:hypothetical protein